MKPETLEAKLLKRIARKRGDVFLRSDFADLGGYDQIGRVLNALIRKKKILRSRPLEWCKSDDVVLSPASLAG